MKMTPREKAALCLNILIALTVPVVWVSMALFAHGGTLTASGFSSLKFFTVLSNVLEGIASLVLAIELVMAARGKRARVRHGAYILKYTAAAAVTVTFSVVAFFFGPLVGWISLYQGTNFWFHLIVPLMAMAGFIFLERFDTASFRETLFGPLPALVYGIFYTLNLLLNGVGEGPDSNDFYGFAHWGIPAGLGIFAAILLLSWGAACLLRALNKKGKKISAFSDSENAVE